MSMLQKEISFASVDAALEKRFWKLFLALWVGSMAAILLMARGDVLSAGGWMLISAILFLFAPIGLPGIIILWIVVAALSSSEKQAPDTPKYNNDRLMLLLASLSYWTVTFSTIIYGLIKG